MGELLDCQIKYNSTPWHEHTRLSPTALQITQPDCSGSSTIGALHVHGWMTFVNPAENRCQEILSLTKLSRVQKEPVWSLRKNGLMRPLWLKPHICLDTVHGQDNMFRPNHQKLHGLWPRG